MSGRWDRLSAEAREVMRLALAESEQLGHGYVGDEHVLLGLLREQASQASSLLREHGLDLGRRGRKHLTQLGWTIGPVNPASALLQAHHVDTIRLRTELERLR